MGAKRAFEKVKLESKLLLDKRARDKQKMQDALRDGIAKKVF